MKMLSTLNEAQARWFVADKALDLGRGGVSRVSRVTGMSRMTITKAIKELCGRGAPQPAAMGRIRRAGQRVDRAVARMQPFPTHRPLCSWTAICPGQEDSAGRRRRSRIRKGNCYLRSVLVEAALAATRANRTALQARYLRIKRHRGHKNAVVATAHQMLTIAYDSR